MVRICGDKGLIHRKFSDGGFKYWLETVVPRYLDFAQGMGYDYLLEVAYRSAQSIYAHFFSNENLFNWYRMGTNILLRILEILNRFNLEEIDSDIIGMVYGRYVKEGKHEQGRYFTPPNVVKYILDSIGYTSDNPDIRGKKLLDLAGGSGSFLVHAAHRLINSYRNPTSGHIPIDNIPTVIQQVKNSFFSLDINPFACYLAETNLLIQVIDLLKELKNHGRMQECVIDRFHIYNTDSLLLPKGENIRTPLLSAVVDSELSIVSQIKERSGAFADGFDFVVGNPPYVRADEPGVDEYRREIIRQGRFETLYKKWDLFIPFIELGKNLLKSESGILGIIISDAYSVATYAQESRKMLCNELTVFQIDFLGGLKLFRDAAVFNVIFIAKNELPTESSLTTQRFHENQENIQEIAFQNFINQLSLGEDIFRKYSIDTDIEDVVLLDEITYISVGMVLNSHETKFPNEFTKDDLISKNKDDSHPVRYIEGKDIERFSINEIRYLEYGENLRAPVKVRRSTFPELYTSPKILRGETSHTFLDVADEANAHLYCNHSVIVFLPWHRLTNVSNRNVDSNEVKRKSPTSLKYGLAYLLAIINSSWADNFLKNITISARAGRFHPDDFRKLPIKVISLEEQQIFIEQTNKLLAWNWELYHLRQSGAVIKFDYDDKTPVVKVDFLQIFAKLRLPSWNFLNAENFHFEVIGNRNQPLSRLRIKDNVLFNGREALLRSDSLLVLDYLKYYLPQFIPQARTWTDLLTIGTIPKTEASIQQLFTTYAETKVEILTHPHHLPRTESNGRCFVRSFPKNTSRAIAHPRPQTVWLPALATGSAVSG